MKNYVYGIIRAADAASIGGAAVMTGGPLGLHEIGPLAAVTSPIDVDEILPVRRNAVAHTRVLEGVMADRPILPMRFGIIVASLDALEAIVRPRAQDLLAVLDELEGKIEVGIKAAWNQTALWNEISHERPDLARASQAFKGVDPNRTYYERIELGRKVESALAEKRADERYNLLQLIEPFAHRLKELSPPDDMTFAHYAMLVDQSRERELYEALVTLESRERNRLDIKFVAPVPAYNFVTISLDWRPAEAA